MAIGLSVCPYVRLSVEADVSSVWMRANTVCCTAGLSSIFRGAWLVIVCVKPVWEQTSVSVKLSVSRLTRNQSLCVGEKSRCLGFVEILVIYHTRRHAGSFADIIEKLNTKDLCNIQNTNKYKQEHWQKFPFCWRFCFLALIQASFGNLLIPAEL